MVFVSFLLGALGLVFGGLASAEQRGRRVAAGLSTTPVPGLRLAPGPTPKCLVAPPPGTGASQTGSVREVWEIARQGSKVLVLDPQEARQAHPVPAGSSPRTYMPPSNLVTPIRLFADDQLRLLPRVTRNCQTTIMTPSP